MLIRSETEPTGKGSVTLTSRTDPHDYELRLFLHNRDKEKDVKLEVLGECLWASMHLNRKWQHPGVRKDQSNKEFRPLRVDSRSPTQASQLCCVERLQRMREN